MSRCDLAAPKLRAGREMIASERLRLDMAGRLGAGENASCIPNLAHKIPSLRLLNSPLSFYLLPRRLMLLSIESTYFTCSVAFYS